MWTETTILSEPIALKIIVSEKFGSRSFCRAEQVCEKNGGVDGD
jgi:hypothetical protein